MSNDVKEVSNPDEVLDAENAEIELTEDEVSTDEEKESVADDGPTGGNPAYEDTEAVGMVIVGGNDDAEAIGMETVGTDKDEGVIGVDEVVDEAESLDAVVIEAESVMPVVEMLAPEELDELEVEVDAALMDDDDMVVVWGMAMSPTDEY